MFGFADVPFPGRAVIEAIGAGVDVEYDRAVTHAALRTSRVDGDQVWITGRVAPGDEADATALLAELDGLLAEHDVTMTPIGGRGEMLLALPGDCGEITDSDPFFENFHPWLRPQACTPRGEPAAEALTAFLLDARRALLASKVNRARAEANLPALDVLTTKWSGTRTAIPSFAEQTGVPGAAVTSTRLYRGLAGILGMAQRRLDPMPDLTEELRARLRAAEELIEDGARFVHVHTKATDEAGHTKQPRTKQAVIEAADAGLDGLATLAERAVVAVTGDHATPSTAGVLHTGDPTPLLVAGPTVRPDAVTGFGESAARAGDYGVVRAAELLPLLFGHANRPVFLGHRATPKMTLALPDAPEPMPEPLN
jgi:2,3-bisphosphoglycerate-independent phosphoglycerate mutase